MSATRITPLDIAPPPIKKQVAAIRSAIALDQSLPYHYQNLPLTRFQSQAPSCRPADRAGGDRGGGSGEVNAIRPAATDAAMQVLLHLCTYSLWAGQIVTAGC